jgi:hypothetical protein
MDRCRRFLASLLAICLFASSCSKTGAKPSPPVVPPPDSTTTTTVGTMNINVLLTSSDGQAELIIAEPGGNILLDTLATANAPVVATLKTNDTLLDVTGVYKYGPQNFYVDVYKSINPSRLTTLINTGYQINVRTGATTKCTNYYYNVPAGVLNYNQSGDYFFTNYPNNEFDGIEASPSDNDMEVTYENYAGNYAYLLFPGAGLYSLHKQVTPVDSVDCSHLDSATLLTFNRPTPFTVSNTYSTFIAIPDTTDLTKLISFTDYLEVSNRPGVDFEYANVQVQKYEMNIYGNYPNNDAINYYCYTGTIPTTLPFPQESDYALSSSQTDNVSVTFPNAKPTFYSAYLVDSAIGYTFYASPDSSTIHPVTFLANQKSKLLAGSNLNLLALKQFGFTYFDGLSYSNYLPFLTNVAAVSAHHPTSVSTLTKSFP